MAYRKNDKSEIFLYDTLVENLFLSEFMPKASGEEIKVYLYAFMYADLGRALTNRRIARDLDLREETVDAAWAYWESKGLVKRLPSSGKEGDSYDVEFLRIKEQVYGRKKNAGKSPPVPEEACEAGDSGEEGTLSVKTASDSEAQASSELEDPAVREMFRVIEEVTGEPVGNPKTIYNWMERYGVPPVTIREAFRYAAYTRHNTRPSYVERIVDSWGKKGLKTEEDIQRHLTESDARHGLYRRVLKALGLYRQATEEEQRMMNSWFDEMGFTIETVLEACRKTAGISNPNIKYIHTVLRGWYKDAHGTDPSVKGDGSVKEGTGPTAAYVRKREAEYRELREAEEGDAEKRRLAVYGRFPRIREIEEQLHEGAMLLTRIALGMAGGMSPEAVRTELDGLEKEKNEILGSAGLTPADLEVHYTCEKCRDTGYLEDGSRCECFIRTE